MRLWRPFRQNLIKITRKRSVSDLPGLMMPILGRRTFARSVLFVLLLFAVVLGKLLLKLILVMTVKMIKVKSLGVAWLMGW